MRIFAIADIHGAMDVYKWFPDAITQYNADVLILAGDLLLGGWGQEQLQQAQTFVIPLLNTLSVPTFFIMGNDDHIDLSLKNDKVRSIHGLSSTLGEYWITGYQFSPPFIGSCHEKPEEEIAEDLSKINTNLNKHTILVTHAPAYGYADRIYSGRHVGSHALAESLENSNILCHIHGHIHHSFGRAGNHFNVAAGGSRRAMIIDLPLLSHEVIRG